MNETCFWFRAQQIISGCGYYITVHINSVLLIWNLNKLNFEWNRKNNLPHHCTIMSSVGARDPIGTRASPRWSKYPTIFAQLWDIQGYLKYYQSIGCIFKKKSKWGTQFNMAFGSFIRVRYLLLYFLIRNMFISLIIYFIAKLNYKVRLSWY